MREGLEKRKKHIPAPEAVVLNKCEGFRRGREACSPPQNVLLHCINGPGPMGFLLMGEGLTGSAGGSGRSPWLGPRGAGSIVVLLALGVAIWNADWRERVGEAGGERSLWSVAVSISSLTGGGEQSFRQRWNA